MENLCSMWSYQESVDELKQNIIFLTLELQQVKKQANEDMRKNKEQINHLLGLLKVAYQERDEARDQIQKLLNKVISRTQPESLLVIPGKANSNITESNSFSEIYNQQSNDSSPIDSFLEAVTSPDISSINLIDSTNSSYGNQPSVQEYNGSVLGNVVDSSVSRNLDFPEEPKIDPASAFIEDLAKGRSLPQKGRLLQSVLESGPLIQTIFVTGPLPRWQNPPTRSSKIPPVPVKGPENVTVNQKPGADPLRRTRKQEKFSPAYYDISRVSPQMCSGSTLNLSSGNLLAPVTGFNNPITAKKRQRFQ